MGLHPFGWGVPLPVYGIVKALLRIGPEPRLVEALEEGRASGVIVSAVRAQLVGAGFK